MTDLQANVLNYGDNLDILRRYVSDASVDLICLDPPFNSDRNLQHRAGVPNAGIHLTHLDPSRVLNGGVNDPVEGRPT